MKNFVIPFHLQDLTSSSASDQYFVDEVFSSRVLPIKLQNAKQAFAKDGGIAVLQYFDVIYSVIAKFNELDPVVRQQTWEILLKTSKNYSIMLASLLSVGSTESITSPTLDPESRVNHKNALKMIIYLLVQMAELYQVKFSQSNERATSTIAAGKKRSKSVRNRTDNDQDVFWITECEMLVRLLMTFVDLDIHRLWEPDLVEDDFVNLVSSMCYKVLESPDLFKAGDIKVPVFHVLGCLIKKYDQSMSASLKLIQLLQHFPHLASPLAEGVSLWQNTFKCKSIVSGVLREISHIPEQEFLRDNDSTKNIGTFLIDLAKAAPSAVLTNFSLMLERMNEESYSMRNTVLSMMGEIVLRALSKEGLDDKSKLIRDQFLDYLYDHANLDPNAFTRSKSLQIWITLVKEQALPLTRYPDLVELCESLLLDKSNLVRKFTVQLLESILRFNPFAPKLPLHVLKAGRDDAEEKLQQLMKELKEKEGLSENETDSEKKSEKEQEEGNEDEMEDEREVFAEDEEGGAESQTSKDKEKNPEITKHKDIVDYLSNSVRFVERLQACIPVLCELLRSRVHSDIIEAISFFTAACQFKIDFAFVGVTAMLQQIWHEEQKIREAVVEAYKQLYFSPEEATPRARASRITDNLMSLMAVSTIGKLKSLEALLNHLSKSGDIPNGVSQILWDRFSKPEMNNSTSLNILNMYEQQKLAVQLIGYLAGTNPSMIKNKLDTLVSGGLAKTLHDFPEDDSRSADYSLALHTCSAIGQLRTKKTIAGKYEKSLRFPENHEMFLCLHHLIVKGYPFHSENWEQFTMEAIALIYDLSENPDRLCKTIVHELLDIIRENQNCTEINKKQILMTRFYMVCGQITLKQLVYLEVTVQAELKHRRKTREEKEEAEKKKKEKQELKKEKRRSGADKPESNLEEDMGVGGATADDAEQEFIRNITETELLEQNNLLGLLAPSLIRACLAPIHADQPGEVAVQATASLALAKYMQVSSKFCEDHLQLLFTLLEKSPHEIVRANLVIPIGDLCVRFPNLLEPWTAHLYARLKDKSSLVRIYAVKVLSNLILNDMVKVKGHVSEMARCTVDENERIASLVKKFFQELSKKGNSIYNVMPDIISRLSDPDVGVSDDEQFQVIMRFLFTFIHKDKQSESLVEKLCHRFSATRTKRQWQDLAFCLSLLSYSERSIRRLQENFTCFADKLADGQVYQCFMSVIVKAKKLAKPEVKAQVDELEILINECHKKGVSDDQTAAKAAAVVKKSRRVSSIRSPRAVIAWPARSPVAREGEGAAVAQQRVKARRKRNARSDDSCSDEDFQNYDQQQEALAAQVARPLPRRMSRAARSGRRIMNFSSDEEEEEADDVKENVAIIQAPTAVDAEEVTTAEGGQSTPIRRKKTPIRRTTRSMLRA